MTSLDHLAAVPSTHRPAARGPRVLVVDPDPRLRRRLLGILRQRQLTVAEAADGDGALQAAREWHPTVAVLELRLGQDGQDGVRVMEAMLEIDPRLQVIFHTTVSDPPGTVLDADGVFCVVPKAAGIAGVLVETITAAHRAYLHDPYAANPSR